MKALSFAFYELFTKNCKRCSLETLLIYCTKFPVLSPSGRKVSMEKVMPKKHRKYDFFLNFIKRYFRTNFGPFCSFSKESYSVLFSWVLAKEIISLLHFLLELILLKPNYFILNATCLPKGPMMGFPLFSLV